MIESTPSGQEFLDKLPDYVNGSLSANDLAWMEQFIRNHPQAEEELQFERMLVSVINGAVSPVSSEEALRQSLVQAEREGLIKPQKQDTKIGTTKPAATSSTVDQNPTWWSRLWQPLPIPAPILATLVAVIVVPSLWFAQRTNLQAPDDSSTYRGSAQIPNMPCAEQYRLRVVFAKNARLEDVSMLLFKLGAEVVAGPTVNGEYWLRSATAAVLQKMAETLKAQPWVDDVWIPPADSTLGCR